MRTMRTTLLVCLAILIGVATTERGAASQDADTALRERARRVAAQIRRILSDESRNRRRVSLRLRRGSQLRPLRDERRPDAGRDAARRHAARRDGLPRCLRATGDRFYLDAARDVALALVKGQYCSGGWDYFIEFDPQKRAQFPYRADGRCRAGGPSRNPERPTTLDDNVTQAAVRLLMRVDRELGFTDRAIHDAVPLRARQPGARRSIRMARGRNGTRDSRRHGLPGAGRPAIPRPGRGRGRARATSSTTPSTTTPSSTPSMPCSKPRAIYNEPRYLAAAEKAGELHPARADARAAARLGATVRSRHASRPGRAGSSRRRSPAASRRA